MSINSSSLLQSALVDYDKYIKSSLLSTSPYFSRYLGNIFLSSATLSREISKYKRLIKISGNSPLQPNTLLIDYGGCHGFLSYILYNCFTADVLMTDAFSESVNNSSFVWSFLDTNRLKFATTLSLSAEVLDSDSHYNNFVVFSYDVIEHIYNIRNFFTSETSFSPTSTLHFIHGSGANPFNLFCKYRDIKSQIVFEYFGVSNSNRKSSCCSSSYFKYRYEFFTKSLQTSSFVAFIYTLLSRGLIHDDLHSFSKLSFISAFLSFLKRFADIGVFNTVDPINGSWMERHHNMFLLINTLKHLNFNSIQLLPGTYPISNISSFTNHIKKIFNFLIKYLPFNLGLLISPDFILSYKYEP